MMINDYFDIGLKIESKRDLLGLAKKGKRKMKYGETEYGSYAVWEIGKNIELWYYGDENGLSPYAMEMYHKAQENLSVVGAEWVNMPENSNDSALLNCFLVGGEIGFPLNIEIVDAFLWRKYDVPSQGEETKIDATWFAKDFTLMKKGTRVDSPDEMAAESVIPCGTFPVRNGDGNWRPSATALMNGTVVEAKLMTNDATNRKYWYLKVQCLGYLLSVVVAPEFVEGEIEPGDNIEGYYWISGKFA